MFGFKKIKNKELDSLIAAAQNNMENNYKDAARKDFGDFVTRFNELKEKGSLTQKEIDHYNDIQKQYEEKFVGYSHRSNLRV